MEFHRKQRFSIRKYAIGVASVLIGLALVGPMVAADTVTSEEQAITASAVDTAQTTEENHPAKEEEAGKTEAPSLSSALDSSQTEGIQPSDKANEPVKESGNEPDKVSAEKEAGSNITPEPEKKSANDHKQPILETTKKATQENIEENSHKEVVEPKKNELDEATPVEALVRLKEEKTPGESPLTSAADKARRIEKTNREHEEFLKELERQSIRFKKLYDINLLFSGLALETTYGDAKKIRGLARVDAVDYAPLRRTRVEEPQPAVASPTTSPAKVSEENSLINLQPLWDKGIKGQGQVVAVIDSGVDPAHDAFRLTDISKAKFKSEADIEAAKK